MRMKNAKSHRS